MQDTSQITNWDAIKAGGEYDVETRVTIGNTVYSGFDGTNGIWEIKRTSSLTNTLEIGRCVASRLELTLVNPSSIPRMAEIAVEIRLKNDTLTSGWLPKGRFFIDTRVVDGDFLRITAYDTMLKTEQDYVQSGSQVAEEYTVWRLASASVDDGSVTGATFTRLYTNKETATNAPVAGDYLSLADGVAKVSTVENDTVTWIADTSFDYPTNWPQPDVLIVGAIAKRVGVPIDAQTLAVLTSGYDIGFPGYGDGAYTMREVLGFIGVMYGGNWCISDAGALRMILRESTSLVSRTEVLVESGTWKAPNNLVGGIVDVAAIGGGGGAAGTITNYKDHHNDSYYGGAGGSGYVEQDQLEIAPGENVAVQIGKGGLAGASDTIFAYSTDFTNDATAGTDGGSTQFGTIVAGGGKGGKLGSIVISGSTHTYRGGNGGKGYAGGGGGGVLVNATSQPDQTRQLKFYGGTGGDAQDGTYGSSGQYDSYWSSETSFYKVRNGGNGAHSDSTGGKGGTPTKAKGGAGYLYGSDLRFGGGGDNYTKIGTSEYYKQSCPGDDGGVVLSYQVKTTNNDIGENVDTFDTSPAFQAISRVTLIVGTDENGVEQFYTAGTDTGRTLEAKCPWATQAITNALLAAVNGYVYSPYTATGVLLDPAAELGDGVTVYGINSQILDLDLMFDALYTADIGAPQDEEVDHEYPFVSNEVREQRRQAATITASLKIGLDGITAEVANAGTWDENGVTIDYYGFGAPQLPVSGNNGKTYLDKSSGYVYTCNGTSWNQSQNPLSTVSNSLSIISQSINTIDMRVAGQYADEWENGVSYPKGRVVKITDTNNASISYYSCKLAHTSDATNKPPAGTDYAQYWDTVTAPTVESIVNIGLNAISVGISSDSNGSKISLTTNGITVESSTIDLHVNSANIDGTITADTVKSTWVYAGDVSASQITAGTINGASETINIKGDINLQMPDGTAVGKIGGFNVGNINFASLSSANGGASVGVAYLNVQDGLPDVVGINADRIQCHGRLQLDNGSYGNLARMNVITSQNPQEGQVFFLIP